MPNSELLGIDESDPFGLKPSFYGHRLIGYEVFGGDPRLVAMRDTFFNASRTHHCTYCAGTPLTEVHRVAPNKQVPGMVTSEIVEVRCFRCGIAKLDAPEVATTQGNGVP